MKLAFLLHIFKGDEKMRSRFQKVMKNQKGMTLVELLAVIVILAIVTAIAVPSIGGIINNSKKSAHISNGLMVINAAKIGVAGQDKQLMDLAENSGNITVTLSQLESFGYLDTVPKDPSAKDSTYDGTSSKVTITKNATSGKYSYSVILNPSGATGTEKAYVNADESKLNAGNAK